MSELTNLCKCGCNQEIVFKSWHKYHKKDIEYIHGHHVKVNHPSLGKKLSDETKNKIKNSLIGNKHSEETKKKMSEKRKGRKHSEKTKLKQSLSKIGEKNPNYGKDMSKYVKMMNEAIKGKPRSEEFKRKVSEGHRGILHTEETKKILSEKHKGKIISEETKRKISESSKGRIVSKETKLLMSNNMIKRIENNGGINPGYTSFNKKGSFFSNKNNKEIKYDSYYELMAFYVLEQISIVKSYDRCKYIVDYKFNNSNHKYIPDIFVEYIDGKKEIIEVKPNFKLKDEKNISKFEAAREYCKYNNMKFNIWSENEINFKKYGKELY